MADTTHSTDPVATATVVDAGEVIAWLYEKNGRQSLQFKRELCLTAPDRGWTETALYRATTAPIAAITEDEIADAISDANDAPGRDSGDLARGVMKLLRVKGVVA